MEWGGVGKSDGQLVVKPLNAPVFTGVYILYLVTGIVPPARVTKRTSAAYRRLAGRGWHTNCAIPPHTHYKRQGQPSGGDEEGERLLPRKAEETRESRLFAPWDRGAGIAR